MNSLETVISSRPRDLGDFSVRRELAAYVVSGEIKANSRSIEVNNMAVARVGEDLKLTASREAHVMLIGGTSLGPRFIYWNFVGRRPGLLDQAKQGWLTKPGPHNPRFPAVPGDAQEFIPLPVGPGWPKGDPL